MAAAGSTWPVKPVPPLAYVAIDLALLAIAAAGMAPEEKRLPLVAGGGGRVVAAGGEPEAAGWLGGGTTEGGAGKAWLGAVLVVLRGWSV